MLPTLEQGVAALRRRRWLELWLAALGAHAQLALFAAGAVVLFGRVLGAAVPWLGGLALALVLVALVTALVQARRGLPDRTSAAAWLDVHGGARGQVVTETELGGSAWTDAARAQLAASLASLPPAAWKRALRPALPALLFALPALREPTPRPTPGPPPVPTRSALAGLEEQLDALVETLALEPETADELAERLARIEAEAESGAEPASTVEAMDRLGERLEAEAARALETAQRAGHELASAAGDPSLADAQTALEAAMAEMDAGGLGKEWPDALERALQPGTLALPPGVQLSSKELVALSRELQGVLDERIAKLVEAGLLDPAALRQLGLGAGEGEGELADLSDLEDHECDEECKQPGGT
jgi:hypothetical protein